MFIITRLETVYIGPCINTSLQKDRIPNSTGHPCYVVLDPNLTVISIFDHYPTIDELEAPLLPAQASQIFGNPEVKSILRCRLPLASAAQTTDKETKAIEQAEQKEAARQTAIEKRRAYQRAYQQRRRDNGK